MSSVIDLIEEKLLVAALASHTAGMLRAHGEIGEGDAFGVVSVRKREEVLGLVATLDRAATHPAADNDTTIRVNWTNDGHYRVVVDEEPPPPEDEWEAPSERPALEDLPQGTLIRVLRSTYGGKEFHSEGGILYRHDGAPEGELPWAPEDPVPVEDMPAFYLNSGDILEWEAA